MRGIIVFSPLVIVSHEIAQPRWGSITAAREGDSSSVNSILALAPSTTELHAKLHPYPRSQRRRAPCSGPPLPSSSVLRLPPPSSSVLRRPPPSSSVLRPIPSPSSVLRTPPPPSFVLRSIPSPSSVLRTPPLPSSMLLRPTSSSSSAPHESTAELRAPHPSAVELRSGHSAVDTPIIPCLLGGDMMG